MKNKLKTPKYIQQLEKVIPAKILSFPEKASDWEIHCKEAIDLFSRFTADIIRERKVFVR